MVFLLLWRESGIYSRVTVGMALQNLCLSVTSGILSSCLGHLGILLEAWQGNMDASRGEMGDQLFFSSCHSDIGIPINFQEKSGIVSFGSIELCVPVEVSKGCEASCQDESET